MKNIHVLPTDEPSRLYEGVNKELLIHTHNVTHKRIWCKHIYITSDEDINENDYIITQDGRLVQVSTNRINMYLLSKDLRGASKVALTTDQDLIEDGVQSIDDEFLEWFVKNPSCEEVKVDLLPYGGTKSISKYWSGEYKIIIPKEETNGCIGINGVSDPKLNEVQLNQSKQETLEEFAEKYANEMFSKNGDLNAVVFTSFIAGAKWQIEHGEARANAKGQTEENPWLSPIESERKWQEEKLVEIFYHYPHASPRWQYMNGLIHLALESKESFFEATVRKVLSEIELVNPAHLEMKSNGHGEFPDSFKLTLNGIEHIVRKLREM